MAPRRCWAQHQLDPSTAYLELMLRHPLLLGLIRAARSGARGVGSVCSGASGVLLRTLRYLDLGCRLYRRRVCLTLLLGTAQRPLGLGVARDEACSSSSSQGGWQIDEKHTTPHTDGHCTHHLPRRRPPRAS